MTSCTDEKRMMNPLMTLVDVASSILCAEMECPSTSSSGRAKENMRTTINHSGWAISRRPFTPPTNTTNTTTMNIVPTVSPTSSVTTTSLTSHTTPKVVVVTVAPPSSSCASIDYEKQTFAAQLVALLDDDNFEFLTWMPDGKAFTIVKPKVFTKEHMPKYFSIRNMSSFVRKLTRWGFTRVHEATTMNSDIFKHPSFQRGNNPSNNTNKQQEGECPIDDVPLKQQTTTSKGATVVPTSPKASFRPISAHHQPTSGSVLPPSSYTNSVLPTMVPARHMNFKTTVPQYLPSQTLALRRFYIEQHHQSWLRARAYTEATSGSLYHRAREGSTSTTN